MKIYDPIHGFIHFYPHEELLIDSRPFQRLRYIHQLGVIYLVYPGATNTRFEHSLGVLKLATSIFRSAFNQESIKEVLERSETFSNQHKQLLVDVLEMEDERREYFLKVLRLAALCHDLGHLPLSHTAEKKLLGEEGHEIKTLEIIFSKDLEAFWDQMRLELGEEIQEEVAYIATGDEALKFFQRNVSIGNICRLLNGMIANDYFGADRIDCLLRDASSTGVSHGVFDYEQLIDSLRIFPYEGSLHIGALRSGISAIDSLLVSRYFMYSRVYRHPIAAAYSFHFEQIFTEEYLDSSFLKSTEAFLAWSDPDIFLKVQELFRKGDLHAEAILDRKKRYRALWLNAEDLNEIDFKAIMDVVEAMKKEGAQIEARLGKEHISGSDDFHSPSPLLSLQWGKIQEVQSKFSYPYLSVSSSYIFIEPSMVDVFKKRLSDSVAILPKLY